ncbi:MAG: efflux transporter outer membrane subunit [Bilophila wadsworthia]
MPAACTRYSARSDARFRLRESSNKGVSAICPPRANSISRQHSLGVGVTSYELDFFGRIQSLKDKAPGNLSRHRGGGSARLSLVSEVAQAYLALVADRERLNIATETLKSQQASYEMIARRHSVGVSSELDLRQAQTSVDTARVDIARYSGQVAKDITALSLLAGTKVTPDMLPAKALSELPVWPDIPVSLPSTVLLQRPDILQAEHTLKAANADIGAARANFFPRISLTANIGTASNELSHLFDGGTGIWTFLPQVSLPIFEGGRNVANLRVSEADKKIAVANYEKAIQSAFREVSDALIDRVSLAGQLEAQKSLVHATSETYRLSGSANQGIDSYLAVLDSQRAMYSSQLNLISVRVAARAEPYHALKALGGGVKE